MQHYRHLKVFFLIDNMQWFECLDVAVRIMASEPLFYVKVVVFFLSKRQKCYFNNLGFSCSTDNAPNHDP